MDHTIAGLPVTFYTNAEGIYTSVLFQNVVIEGSPLVVHFNPPVAGIEGTGVPAVLGLVQALLGTLR